MQINKYLTAGLLATFAFTACGGGAGGGHPGTTPPNVPNQANLTTNVLQFAVGTANYAGVEGLNVVATYRQPKGAYDPGGPGSLVNSPTLTIPGTLPTTPGNISSFDSTIVGTAYVPPGASSPAVPASAGGPSSSEAGGHVMSSTSQTGTNSTTFGISGGVSDQGIEPFNYQEGDLPASGTPYSVPVYDTLKGTTGDPNAFAGWGGEPAFNANGNGAAQYLGVSMGLNVFQSVAPTVGQYELTLSIPANTGTVTQTAGFALASIANELGTATAPTLVADGAGGGTLTYAMPNGATNNATEAYIMVTNYGEIQPTTPGATPYNECGLTNPYSPYTTLEVTTQPGGTVALPANTYCTAAQNATANPTVAPGSITGDQIVIQLIGFDYPWYEASVGTSLSGNGLDNPVPTIVGAAGTDDIAISTAVCSMDTAGVVGACPNPLPLNDLSKFRHATSRATIKAKR